MQLAATLLFLAPLLKKIPTFRSTWGHYFLNFFGSLQGNHCDSGFFTLLLRFYLSESPKSLTLGSVFSAFQISVSVLACVIFVIVGFCLFETFLYCHCIRIFKGSRGQRV